ncbi:MAG: hypothetical protein H7343_14530 [Undibacterium sp.]|nr:hypothetical protein [Opitutaceae bacterium]
MRHGLVRKQHPVAGHPVEFVHRVAEEFEMGAVVVERVPLHVADADGVARALDRLADAAQARLGVIELHLQPPAAPPAQRKARRERDEQPPPGKQRRKQIQCVPP